MTHPRLRFIHKHQRGFTLIELLIAIALVGLITGGITAAISQVLTINTRASNHMIAVRQVQQAGKEVRKDALQAQPHKIDDSPPGGDFLVLNWTDWEGLENEVVYTITEDNELQRSHTVNGETQATARLVVAEYIDPAQTSCVWVGGVLTFTVTATFGKGSQPASETRIYEVKPRPTAPE